MFGFSIVIDGVSSMLKETHFPYTSFGKKKRKKNALGINGLGRVTEVSD